ncbi:hypothetical protein JAAARDRAFT_27573 [Jaapia argillacea MUCL 33604]|uniref:C2H2-type domain-containing protein n=1 Tax=Jaapia argillacea MUCL 33604 TaxID=933084 RepID=A0A067QCN4_9AGAM|nr:hypothetical protein JAAARDRAFT_27573 [Jaapia argillacea MUCL 33604]
MPREISTRHDLYSSFPDQTHDLVYAHHSPADSTSEPASPSDASSPASASGQKKKHVCNTCGRAFSTSGHLARHARVHTGERNHKCPFPGCQTRCSRQDNLQQQ